MAGEAGGLVSRAGRMLAAFLLVATPAFYVFSYNSGYGYDPMEYLVIGRSLADGYRLYDFIPSKSFGIYVLVAALLRGGLGFGHGSLAAVVTAVFVSMVVLTYVVAARRLGPAVGLLGAVFVAIAAAFMEMNFLEPEAFVFVFGLLGFDRLCRFLETLRSRDVLVAGLATGLGVHVKLSALLYVAGAALYVGIHGLALGRTREALVVRAPLLVGGALLAALPAAAYFAVTDRLGPFWEWTVAFPLVGFPAGAEWMGKLFTKLLWLPVLLLAALAASLHPSVRERIWSDDVLRLSLCLGLVPMTALARSQVGHYYFLGAPFMGLFVAAVAVRRVEAAGIRSWRDRRVAAAGAAAVLVVAGSGLLYQPGALGRLGRLRAFPEENKVRAALEQLPAGRALFFGQSARLYWFGGRYPNVPFIHFDVQTVHYLRRHGDVLLEALDDPELRVVEFDADARGRRDQLARDDPELRALIEAFEARLRERFVRVETALPDRTFWTRR